jgi:hypothetical protein
MWWANVSIDSSVANNMKGSDSNCVEESAQVYCHHAYSAISFLLIDLGGQNYSARLFYNELRYHSLKLIHPSFFNPSQIAMRPG